MHVFLCRPLSITVKSTKMLTMNTGSYDVCSHCIATPPD